MRFDLGLDFVNSIISSFLLKHGAFFSLMSLAQTSHHKGQESVNAADGRSFQDYSKQNKLYPKTIQITQKKFKSLKSRNNITSWHLIVVLTNLRKPQQRWLGNVYRILKSL